MRRTCAIPVGERVGSFQYLRAEDRWEWSDAVAQMHGYAPGQVQPTTAMVMSHKHPDDAAAVAQLIEAMTGKGKPFSSRHRIIDTQESNTKLRKLASQVVDDFTVELQVPPEIRKRADHLLLTAHHRVRTPLPPPGSHSNAC